MSNTLLYEFWKGGETCLRGWGNLSLLDIELEISSITAANLLAALHYQEILTLPFLPPWSIPYEKINISWIFCVHVLWLSELIFTSLRHMMPRFQIKLRISITEWSVPSKRLREGMKLTQIPCLPSPCSLSKPQTLEAGGMHSSSLGAVGFRGCSSPVSPFL